MFPILIDENKSEVLITLDQSATVAGFLMYGNSFGVLFCSITFRSPKYPVCFCLFVQMLGWWVMYYADNITTIFISRFFVGMGNGFGTTQLKYYIQETCDENWTKFLCKYLNSVTFVGVVLINVASLFCTFRSLALFGLGFPAIGLLVFGLMPKYQKIVEKVVTIATIDVNVELNAPQKKTADLLTDGVLRNNIIFIIVVTILAQYTGFAANIVYSQIIFTTAGAQYPKLLPIFYAMSVLCFTILSIKRIHKHSIIVYITYSFPLVALVNLLYSTSYMFSIGHYAKEMNFPMSDLALILLSIFYASVHTFGFTTVPLLILNQKIPDQFKDLVYKIFVITFSLSAVTSTKLFQYIFTYTDMGLAYLTLSFIAFCGFVIVYVLDTFFGNTIKTTQKYEITKLKTTHF